MTTDISRQQFLQALRDHPEWREEIRKEILGEELLRLPVEFRAFVVRQEEFNDEMREFRQEALERFEQIDHRFDNIDRRLDRWRATTLPSRARTWRTAPASWRSCSAPSWTTASSAPSTPGNFSK